jgi:type I restriction enzyme M protein
MVALKGKSDIGDQINKKIIAPLAKGRQLKQDMIQKLLTGRTRLI